MTNAVTGRKPEQGDCVVPESLREMIKEAARRAAPKVRQAVQTPRAAVILKLPDKTRDS
ncbi:hypothetical protein PS627_00059 [Pseudomonas fluorescens]|jgi:hypothetical protein|nr:hypothetical protein PS627_00059 [Pseudomonas fluorescens]